MFLSFEQSFNRRIILNFFWNNRKFPQLWTSIFFAFQYLLIQQTPFVRRQVRKVLLSLLFCCKLYCSVWTSTYSNVVCLIWHDDVVVCLSVFFFFIFIYRAFFETILVSITDFTNFEIFLLFCPFVIIHSFVDLARMLPLGLPRTC